MSNRLWAKLNTNHPNVLHSGHLQWYEAFMMCSFSAFNTIVYVWSACAVNHQPQTQCIICICVCSLELFCSSHAGMDTFVLYSILCNKMLPPHNSIITWVIRHYTLLASKFLLLVLWVTTVITQQETYFYVSMATVCHDIHSVNSQFRWPWLPTAFISQPEMQVCYLIPFLAWSPILVIGLTTVITAPTIETGTFAYFWNESHKHSWSDCM